MKIVEGNETSRQECRNCNIRLELEKADMFASHGWFCFKCIKCNKLTEAYDVPSSYYSILREVVE